LDLSRVEGPRRLQVGLWGEWLRLASRRLGRQIFKRGGAKARRRDVAKDFARSRLCAVSQKIQRLPAEIGARHHFFLRERCLKSTG
jgi:hypothetical protein